MLKTLFDWKYREIKPCFNEDKMETDRYYFDKKIYCFLDVSTQTIVDWWRGDTICSEWHNMMHAITGYTQLFVALLVFSRGNINTSVVIDLFSASVPTSADMVN